MKLEVLEQISHPGGTTNEDLFDHNQQAAWIFDGASGIGPKTIASAPTDPYWLVQTMNTELKRVWQNDQPTPVLLAAAAQNTIAQYKDAAGESPPALIDGPTACLTMARLWKGQLEISSAGDCWAIYRTGGKLGEFGAKHDALSKPVRAERARLSAEGIPVAEIQKRLAPFERAFRMQANIDGGYPIVDTTSRWVERMRTQTVAISPGDRLLLMTDGFYRLIDTIKSHDAASLLQAVENQGLAALYKDLRAKETADRECKLYPRAKIHDDVAAGLVTVQP